MEITRELSIKLYNIFEELKNRKCDIKFAYFIAKNKRLLSSEIEILSNMITPNEKYKEYDLQRVQINEKYCEKDNNGNLIIKDNSYIIKSESLNEFHKELNILKEQYSDYIKEHNKMIEQYNSLLLDKININLHQINITDISGDINPTYIEVFLEANLIIE